MWLLEPMSFSFTNIIPGLFLLTGILLQACHTSKPLPTAPAYEFEQLDTLVVRSTRTPGVSLPEYQSYQASATRIFDLLHTTLHLEFDREERSVSGRAILRLRPYFRPANTLVLDAVGFTIHRVLLSGKKKDFEPEFTYDGSVLRIFLDRNYQRREELELIIEYTAFPEIGASEHDYAIGSDQGLFFIDPLNNDPARPTQIWTQGETQYNSRWFPTIDRPNERCTQEIYLTVEDHLTTVSNGLLAGSIYREDGMRTDHWVLDLPHAPYLFAVVVGEFAVKKDYWKDIELTYLVDPAYAADARHIFRHTPEMLSFFSDITGFTFPWPSYKQVIVTDFVSGAMENTTAVVFSDVYQKCREELVDDPNDLIVAHEMFHHWFGNLLTCESWSNLTLNEGFANYAEYLWLEHKYGPEEAELHRLNEREEYLNQYRFESHPLIDYQYREKDALFDAHSYNKGGLVLHMLRRYLGDEAFFSGINTYLIDNAFGSVEAHQLRLAMESVSGEDLNWFFNQWFFGAGHPELDFTYNFSDSLKTLEIKIDQVQDAGKNVAVFRTPMTCHILLSDGTIRVHDFWLEKRNQRFEFILPVKPEAVFLNPDKEILCEILSAPRPTEDALQKIYLAKTPLIQRLEAVSSVGLSPDSGDFLLSVLSDPHWIIRLIALQSLESPLKESFRDVVESLMKSDPNSRVRSQALSLYLEDTPPPDYTTLLDVLEKDSSSLVISLALYGLYSSGFPDLVPLALRWKDNNALDIESIVGAILSSSGNASYLSYFEERIFTRDVSRNGTLIYAYSNLLNQLDEAQVVEKCRQIKDFCEEQKDLFTRQVFYRLIRNQIDEMEKRLGETTLPETQDVLTDTIRKLEKLLPDQ